MRPKIWSRRPSRHAIGALIWLLCANAAAAFPAGRCINLSNAMEAPVEGEWGHVIARSDLAAIAEAGYDTVRLPVRASAHWDGRIAPAFLARIDEVIGWAGAEGLQVILDLHHFRALYAEPDANEAKLLAIWDQLAARHAGRVLAFEIMNEPEETITTARAFALQREALAVIRAHDPDAWVIVTGADWGGIDGLLDLPPLPDDPRLVRSFHYYAPWHVTHQGATWTGRDMPPRSWGTATERAALAADFARLPEGGAPLFMGEFGMHLSADPATRRAWLSAVTEAAEARGIPWCVWGFAGDIAVRDKGRWLPSAAPAIPALR
ncbi:MAG: glycoside hydrolase family 5 protein [Hasllibacter sp.]